MRALTVELLTRRNLFAIDVQGIDELDALLGRIVADVQARGKLRPDTEPRRLAALVREPTSWPSPSGCSAARNP